MAKPEELVKGARVRVVVEGVLPATLFPDDTVIAVDISEVFEDSPVRLMSVPIDAIEVLETPNSGE